MLDDVQTRLAMDDAMPQETVRTWQRMRSTLQRQIGEEEVRQLRAATQRANDAHRRTRAARAAHARSRENLQHVQATDAQRLVMLRHERDLLQAEREAIDEAEAAEADQWAMQQLQDQWERRLSWHALKGYGGRLKGAVAGAWASGKGTQRLGELHSRVNLTREHANRFAAKVGEGDWEEAQGMLPSMLRGLVEASDDGHIVSTAAVMQQASALLQEVREHAAHMETVRAPWTRVTARVLTSEQKRRVTRMWDYVVTYLIDMQRTLQARRRMPQRVLNLAAMVLRELRQEVVQPFIRLTQRVVVVAEGRRPVQAQTLRGDVQVLMAGLRRLQALMMRTDVHFSSQSGIRAMVGTAAKWITAALSSVLSVVTHQAFEKLWSGVHAVNSLLFRSTWYGCSAYQSSIQFLATTSWAQLALYPRKRFLQQLSDAAVAAAAALRTAKAQGVTGPPLEELDSGARQAYAAVSAALNTAGAGAISPWRERIARLIHRALRSLSNGSQFMPKPADKTARKAFTVTVTTSTGQATSNLAEAVEWPETGGGEGAAGWAYRILTFPYSVSVAFVEAMLRLLGRVLTGNVGQGSDAWAEKVAVTPEERARRGWWRSLLGADDASNDGWVFYILKTALVTLVFPIVMHLLSGMAKGALRRVFGSVSSVSSGVLNAKERWQCDEAAAKCRAVLIPRDHLGKVFASRKACDTACSRPHVDPIEEAYHWEMDQAVV